MKGIDFQLDDSGAFLKLLVKPSEVDKNVDAKVLINAFKKSNYAALYLSSDNVINVHSLLVKARKEESNELINEVIAEKKDAVIKFHIEDNDSVAFIAITAAFGGASPTAAELLELASKNRIKRGISKKTLNELESLLKNAEPGSQINQLIAKGLPVKNGKDSKLKPLVPNALERILKPQTSGSNRVDMRNLGDVICVKANTEVLRRLPPSKGRSGFTVTDDIIAPKPGSWVKFKPGEGIKVSDKDNNLYLAAITGMPKFQNNKMWVDDTFICKGVNVGTGNIKYDGAVLVNGDVTEKMEITASGDVTINGFVESATIKAGGDIIITEGAMGKVNEHSTEFSTKLTAEGNIHVQHGQGLNVQCNGNVTIGRQLAYSKIVCGGSVTIGPIDKPNGNLFACDIQCKGAITAGTLGAVSGSHLNIDFSHGFNTLLERKDTIEELLVQLRENNLRHRGKFDLIRSKNIHPELKRKLQEAEEMFNNESQLLEWLEAKSEKMKLAKDTYQQEIKLVANKRLYAGVVVKLNNRTWRAEREYAKAKIHYEGHQWNYEPLI